MEKARQVKILSIVALVIAIAGMALGFAAFSTTLSISSSATVTPSSDDFKITIYGIEDEEKLVSFINYNTLLEPDILSSTSGGSVALYKKVDRSLATIDNVNHTISGINVNFENKEAQVIYIFGIVNEGKYDAYMDLSEMSNVDGKYSLSSMLNKRCIPDAGTSDALVTQACAGLEISTGIFDNETDTYKEIEDDYLKIPVGEYELLFYSLYYKGPFADGPFNVEIDDFQFKFSTVK